MNCGVFFLFVLGHKNCLMQNETDQTALGVRSAPAAQYVFWWYFNVVKPFLSHTES